MTFIDAIFRPGDVTPSKRKNDETVTDIISCMLRLERNAGDASAREAFDALRAKRPFITDDQLQELLAETKARKAADAAARLEADAISDEAEELVDREPVILRHADEGARTGEGVICVEDYLAKGAPRLELGKYKIRFPASYTKHEREYLRELALRLHSGELRPGSHDDRGGIAFIQHGGDTFPPVRQTIPVFVAEDDLMGFDPSIWQFVRRRGQSERQFKSALAAQAAKVKTTNDVNNMTPRYAGASRW